MTSAANMFQTLAAGLNIDPQDSWQPSVFEGHLALDCANRYFTSTKFVQTSQCISFQDTVDPEGVLQGLEDNKFVHTDENEVEYIKLVSQIGHDAR